MLEKLLRLWSRIETILVGTLMFAALAIFLGGAVVRAVAPLHAVDWAEEVSLYCIVWATVIAGAGLVAEGRHISTGVFVARLSPGTRRAVGWLTAVLATGFCVAMLVYGWQATQFSAMLDERSASTLRTPQAYALFLALPVGMALILLRVAALVALGRRPFAGEDG
jgi:TRAP-type C4-dicarboxylate transport system permease small subunit